MTFECLVDQEVTCLDTITTRVAGLGIVSGEHKRREGIDMLVTRKDFVRRVMRKNHAGGWVRRRTSHCSLS